MRLTCKVFNFVHWIFIVNILFHRLSLQFKFYNAWPLVNSNGAWGVNIWFEVGRYVGVCLRLPLLSLEALWPQWILMCSSSCWSAQVCFEDEERGTNNYSHWTTQILVSPSHASKFIFLNGRNHSKKCQRYYETDLTISRHVKGVTSFMDSSLDFSLKNKGELVKGT